MMAAIAALGEGSPAAARERHIACPRDGVHITAQFDGLAFHPDDACFKAGEARVRVYQSTLGLVQTCARVRQRIELLTHVSDADRYGLAYFADLLR